MNSNFDCLNRPRQGSIGALHNLSPEAGSVEIKVQRLYDPYNFQILSMRCGQLLFFVTQSVGRVRNRAVTSFFFLQIYRVDLRVTTVGTGFAMVLASF